MYRDKDKLSHLIDEVYELAGLLEVARRSADLPLSLPRLIAGKARAIADACSSPEVAVMDNDTEKMTDVVEESKEVVEKCEVPSLSCAPAETPVSVETPAPADSRGCVRNVPKITLNDRFLFARELFGGSQSELRGALEILAADPGAVRQFAADRGWDPETPEVIRFISLFD